MERRHRIAIGVTLALFLAGAVTRVLGPAAGDGAGWGRTAQVSGSGEFGFDRDIEPILMEHCYDCHGDGVDKGGVVLDAFESPQQRHAAIEVWESVHHNVEGLLMPPTDKPPLSDRERRLLADWIEKDVFRLDPERPDPGHVTVRRLNRVEYRNSLRDLLGELPLDPSADLPADDTGYGFDNVGDVLTMSPDLLERYVLAADRVLSASLRTRPPDPPRLRLEPDRDFRGVRHAPDGTGDLASQGTVGVRVEVKRAGKFRVRILVGADHAGDELPRMSVRVPGSFERVFEVEAPTGRPRFYEAVLQVPRGERWIEMAFINDYYEPTHPDPRRRDRNLHIRRVEWIGPLDVEPPPPSRIHQRIFALGGSGSDARRAERILTAFARRAWRRPVTGEEVSRLLRLVEMAREEGDSFEAGVQLALQAILVSPRFLFRGEGQGPGGKGEKGIVPLTGWELATRLSFFLWSSLPDEHLLGLAEQGRLRRDLKGEVARMLHDPKARALTENFAGQWLQLRNLDLVTPDPGTFRTWDEPLKASMRRETEHFFAAVFAENRSLIDFLDADYSYLDGRLARHYGIGGIEGERFQQVALRGEHRLQRGGLLTQASILTVTSNPTRTSPVNRGNWVLENILGTPPPPALDDVPGLQATAADGRRLTLREQLEKHRADPRCAGCHARMDPIGFAMENYDGIGAWREIDAGTPIDASGALHTGESFRNLAELRRILSESKREAFVRNLARTLLIYALGRGLEYYDKPALNRIFERVEADGFRSHSLVEAVVNSVPFQYRRAADP